MKHRVHALLAYAFSVVSYGFLAIVSIPLMISAGGVDAWASVAAGQAVGVIAAVLIGYAWSLTGPTRAARALSEEVYDLYLASVKMRLSLFIPVVAASTVALFLLIPHLAPVEASLGLISTAMLGLRANWFYTGANKPFLMLFMESTPRVVCISLGLLLGSTFGSIVMIVLGQIVGLLTAFVLCTIEILWSSRKVRASSRLLVRKLLRDDWQAFSASIVGTIFAASPVLLVAGLSPATLPTYALIDRLWKQLNTASSPFYDVIRSWVPAKSEMSQNTKYRLVLSVGSAAIFAATGLLMLVGPALFEYLSAGEITVSPKHVGLFGLLFFLSNVALLLDQVILVAMDEILAISRAMRTSTVVGLGLLVATVLPFGLLGVLLSLAIGYAVRIAWCLRVWRVGTRG